MSVIEQLPACFPGCRCDAYRRAWHDAYMRQADALETIGFPSDIARNLADAIARGGLFSLGRRAPERRIA